MHFFKGFVREKKSIVTGLTRLHGFLYKACSEGRRGRREDVIKRMSPNVVPRTGEKRRNTTLGTTLLGGY